MNESNRQFRLAKRPVGLIKKSDFDLSKSPIPEPGDNQALVRTLYISIDPTNRIWASDMDGYMPPVAIGEVMRTGYLGQVVRSNSAAYKAGDLVTGIGGWQEYALVSPKDAFPVSPLPKIPGVPLPVLVGALGITGMTAYFGLLDLGKPKPGETVVVSAAAGAVGSVVGQIAKIKGCRVVGIAGSAKKCAWVVDDLGFDAAINYRDADWKAKLAAACPKGVDVNFENVGGEIMDTLFGMLNMHARVVVCGLISSYNATEPVPGPYNFSAILMKRARVEGFIILDFAERFGEAGGQLGEWYMSGKLKHRDTVVEGFENTPTAVNQLFSGENIGKLLVHVADAS